MMFPKLLQRRSSKSSSSKNFDDGNNNNENLDLDLVLTTGIVIGSTTTLLVVYAVNKYRRYYYGNQQDSSNDFVSSSSSLSSRKREQQQQQQQRLSSSSSANDLPQQLRDEQLSRHALYFGNDGMIRLQNARVLVVGLGGVGSHTAHMLARGGVGFLRLVDFDQISLSSLNRHAVATLQDVGTSKATCLKQYLKQICPSNYVQIDARNEMYTAETGTKLLQLDGDVNWDIVIDAIDDTKTKAVLIKDCLTRRIPILSCMGAGGKSDYTRLHLSDLRTATRDPLASKLRQELRNYNLEISTNATTTTTSNDKNGNDNSNNTNTNTGSYYLDDMDQLSVLYSSEKPVVKLADFTEEQHADVAGNANNDDNNANAGGYHQYGAVDGMRIRVLPVLGTTPAIFGQALAATCLTRLANKPFQPVTGERIGRNARNKAYQQLKRREDLITKRVLVEAGLDVIPEETGCVVNNIWIGPLAIDHDDIEYLLEIWRNKCAITGARLGTVLHLCRWNLNKPGTCDNLVLMSVNVMKKYNFDYTNTADNVIQNDEIPADVRKRIEARLSTCRVD